MNSQRKRNRLTQFDAVAAVDVGQVIALVFGALERVEDESVVAQFLLGHAIYADVVFVALEIVLVLAIFRRADELTWKMKPTPWINRLLLPPAQEPAMDSNG